MENEQRVIKLSPEQIEARKLQLEREIMTMELNELSIKHTLRAIELNIPNREAKSSLNNLNQKIETNKHNIVALKEQIEKGEM